jgi:hypothetical protein
MRVCACVRPLCCVRSFELVLVNPHENIVSVYGICTDAPDGNLRLVMRLCVKSVWDLLQQHRPRVSHPLLGRFTLRGAAL